MSYPNQNLNTLDASEVAQILKCSLKTVLEKASLGEIRGMKIGKKWAFKVSDVEQYIEDQIERQTEARISRYTRQNREQNLPRGFSGPIKKRQSPPDLSPYRQFLKP